MFGHLNHGRNDGLGDGVTIVTGAGAEIVEYSTESAIVAGDVLGLSGGGLLVTEATAAQALVIGVALETITGTVADPERVRVLVAGYVEGVNAATTGGGAVSGDIIVMSATAGEVAKVGTTSAGALPLGVAQSGISGNVLSMYWFRKA